MVSNRERYYEAEQIEDEIPSSHIDLSEQNRSNTVLQENRVKKIVEEKMSEAKVSDFYDALDQDVEELLQEAARHSAEDEELEGLEELLQEAARHSAEDEEPEEDEELEGDEEPEEDEEFAPSTIDCRISFYSYEIENLGSLNTKDRMNYFVVVPFTLEKAGGVRRYLELSFEIEFDDETHIVRDLAPKEVEQIQKDKRYWISPRLRFSDMEVEIGGAEIDFTIEKLVPRITPFFRGEPRAKWLHENEDGLESGCKYACLLLSVPEETESIHGTIQHSATVSTRFFERDEEVEKEVPTHGGGNFTWELPNEDEVIYEPMDVQPLSTPGTG